MTKITSGGTAKTTFSVATSERYKDKTSGEWKDSTDWHNVVLWKQEALSEYLKKGKQVYIEGKLKTREWEQDGVKKYATEVLALEIMLLGGGESRGQASGKPSGGNSGSGDDFWE